MHKLDVREQRKALKHLEGTTVTFPVHSDVTLIFILLCWEQFGLSENEYILLPSKAWIYNKLLWCRVSIHWFEAQKSVCVCVSVGMMVNDHVIKQHASKHFTQLSHRKNDFEVFVNGIDMFKSLCWGEKAAEICSKPTPSCE